MRLSIIIPVYNVEKYIAGCLDSLLNQDLNTSEYEILIINDGSEDNSIVIAKQYEQNYSNIYIHNQKNAGVGSARNKGIKLAKGKYIYFIDPDDYLASNVLNLIVSCCDTSELEVLTFLSKGTTFSNLNESISNKNETHAINKMSGIDYIGNVGYKNEVWWYVIKKDFLKEHRIEFIEGRWMEDAIFTATLFCKTKAIGHLPIDAHRHVKRQGSAMTNKEPSHYLKVIYDNENAALMFNPLINTIDKTNEACIKRLKARQQSFVFFLLIRILKSTITFKEVKKIIENMNRIQAYPLNAFLGKDYNGTIYIFLTKLFSIKHIYYLLFLTINPFLKRRILSKN